MHSVIFSLSIAMYLVINCHLFPPSVVIGVNLIYTRMALCLVAHCHSYLTECMVTDGYLIFAEFHLYFFSQLLNQPDL